MDNLAQEGFSDKPVHVLNVGDVMQDSALFFAQQATAPQGFDLADGFILTTLHRAENTDDSARLTAIVSALNTIHSTVTPVVLPLHPRTRAAIDKLGLTLNVYVIDPVGYLEMIWLLQRCGLVLTDSGGVQKEAFFFGKSCVTLRDQTEWVELVTCGANVLVGADRNLIVNSARTSLGKVVQDDAQLYGGGQAATRIADYLVKL